MKSFARAALAVALVSVAETAHAADLSGSAASMRHQHGVAVALAYTFLGTPSQVQEFVDEGRLEPVDATADLALSGVSFPYARPEVKLFVDRLAEQYHAANGARLVVTSLVRPRDEQPKNASPLSVHPAGMAVDLRVPASASARAWLERTLLSLEKAGVLDVTRELHPSHFHVAVFPDAYRAYAARTAPPASTPAAPSVPAEARTVAAAPVVSASDASPIRSSAPPALDALALLLLAVPLGAAMLAHARIPANR